MAELARGKTGRVYGDLIALLTVMKVCPHNKDMQEDKEQVFDAVDTVLMTLPVFTKMLATMKIKKEKMKKEASGGFTNATDAADYLVKKGLPFRDAHRVIGEMVTYCIKAGKGIEELTLQEFKEFCDLFGEDIYSVVSLESCIDQRDVAGGTSTNQVKKAITNLRRL